MSRRERHQRRVRHRGHPFVRVITMAGVLAVCAAAIGALAAVGWVVAVAQSAPNLSQLPPREPHPPTEIFASDGTLLGYVRADTVFSYVPPNRLPNRLREATVAIEDRRFYHHGALDYQGILRAGIRDAFGGRASLQGASTLTMQLVDNDYMPRSILANHNLRYKIIQAKLAQQLEQRHGKNWILDNYLNDVPYGASLAGEDAIGVGAAAEIFFGKPVWRLNLAQEALLAGLPQAPTGYNPFRHWQAARQRRREVLQAMVNSGYISQALADAVDRQPLQVSPNVIYGVKTQPFIFNYAQQQLEQKLCPRTPTTCPEVTNGGLKVYTTINLSMEQEALNAILSHQGGTILDNQPAAALASVDPNTGHIMALAQSAPYGSAPGTQTNFFFPVSAHRQPGSAFKVFALMTLIHDYHGDPSQTYYTSKFLPVGWEPADPTWSVHTAEETYQGNINITKATIVSDNTVFAQLAADLGWDKLDATAHAMGVTSPLNAFPSEVIGGLKVGVTPLEMADAYATLANGGYHIPPTIIDRAEFPNGRSVSFADPPRTKVFSDGETAAAISVLKQVITSGTGTAAGYGCPAAGKTGTANNMDNAWFVGFTPKFSTGVWVGYPQGNVPMPNGFGGALAAPIWHDFMTAASNGYCGDFPQPTNPFSGTAFSGPHSSSNSPSTPSGNGSTSTTTGTGTTTNAYTNPTLYAQPPQPPSNSGGTGLTPGKHSGSGGGGGKKHK